MNIGIILMIISLVILITGIVLMYVYRDYKTVTKNKTGYYVGVGMLIGGILLLIISIILLVMKKKPSSKNL